MNLIDRIYSVDELKSFRDHVGLMIEDRFGSPLKGRNLDEFTADLLKAKDFNTAMGLARIAESVPKGVITHQKTQNSLNGEELKIRAWFCVLTGCIADGYISAADAEVVMDEAVDEFVGTSQDISDNINNQGLEQQVRAIASKHCLPLLKVEVSDATGITVKDLERCLEECEAQLMNLSEKDAEALTPFDVRLHVGY